MSDERCPTCERVDPWIEVGTAPNGEPAFTECPDPWHSADRPVPDPDRQAVAAEIAANVIEAWADQWNGEEYAYSEIGDGVAEALAAAGLLRAPDRYVEVDWWCHFDDKGRAVRVHDGNSVHMDGCTRLYVSAAADALGGTQ